MLGKFVERAYPGKILRLICVPKDPTDNKIHGLSSGMKMKLELHVELAGDPHNPKVTVFLPIATRVPLCNPVALSAPCLRHCGVKQPIELVVTSKHFT